MLDGYDVTVSLTRGGRAAYLKLQSMNKNNGYSCSLRYLTTRFSRRMPGER